MRKKKEESKQMKQKTVDVISDVTVGVSSVQLQ